jgi:hypothetical protein
MDMDKELNCSEGARMLIERMQSHPKDFKYEGRFSRIVDQILGKVPVGFSELSNRDMSALTIAFQKYIMEPSLTEYVVDEIFNGDKRREEQQEQQNLASQYTSALAASIQTTKNTLVSNILSGVADPRNTYGNAIYNPAQGKQLWKYEEEEKALQLSIMDKIRRKLKGEPK